MGNPPVDPEASDAFEAAGWEEKAAAYERFFAVISGRVVEPLLAAASVGVAPGPDFFRFSDDETFAAALRQQGLARPAVSPITFVLRFASADELWNSMLAATVRVSALIERQPEDVRQRIRAAFDRLADGYRRGGVLDLPVAVKLATAQKPDPG